MNGNKIRVALGVLAFASLAVLNFTQSERSFVNGTLASSDESWVSSAFSTVVDWVSTIISSFEEKTYECKTKDCEVKREIEVEVAGVKVKQTVTFNGKMGYCAPGNVLAHCIVCKPITCE